MCLFYTTPDLPYTPTSFKYFFLGFMRRIIGKLVIRNLHYMKNVCLLNRLIWLSLVFLTFVMSNKAMGQPVPASRITDWSKAGLQDTVPSYANVINIMNYGGDNTGSTFNNTAFQSAVAALAGNAGVVYFPAGTYLFNQPISLVDSLVIRGAGKDSTKLLFNLGGAFLNMVNIEGSTGTTTWNLVQTANKNDSSLAMNSVTGLNVGDWVMIADDDSNKVTSPWAYGSTGQIFQIENISGNTIESARILRRAYSVDSIPYIRKITPITGSGIECLYLERQDSTGQQTNNIYINYAANCWVVGVESNNTNFAHIGINNSSHMLIRGNYIHHSHGYGGGGRGYGVVLQYTSGDCLVDNNIFEFLRHSMLLQLGANGNVLAYNYSKDPNWLEPPFPANAAGDAVLHGDYPYLNLFEGNILAQIVVDNSHGINGPCNTFFRNRAQLYGIFMNSGTGATDSVNYVGNEVTNTGLQMGNFSLAGTGHYSIGNIIKGNINPTGTAAQEPSLYLISKPSFWMPPMGVWPIAGNISSYNQNGIPAQIRYVSEKTDCRTNPQLVGDYVRDIKPGAEITVYPNPTSRAVAFDCKTPKNAVIHVSDIMGRRIADFKIKAGSTQTIWDVSEVEPGIYLYTLLVDGMISKVGKLIINE